MRRSLILVLLLFAAAPLAAQEKRPMSVEDVWNVKRLGKPAISPDGKRVVVEAATYSMDENSHHTDLWLFATDGKERKQLTTYKGQNAGAAWSPGGEQIAFVSKRSGDVAQIFLIAPGGGEARQLTHLPMSPTGLKWAPDGKSLFCIVNTWPDTPDDASYKKKEKARKDDKVQAYVIDDALYRVWDHWIADGKRPVVFVVDATSGKHHNLFVGTKLHLPIGDASAASYDIAPDGKELCFTAETTKEIGTDFNADLYTMPLDQPGEPRNVTPANLANDFNPVYSPDGKAIAFLRQTTKYFYADRARLMRVDRKTGDERELTAELDRTVHNQHWTRDCDALFFEAEDRGYRRLYRVGADGQKLTALTQDHSDSGLSLSQDGTQIVFMRSTFGRPAELMTGPATSPKRLDRFNDDITSRWKLGEVKDVTFKGADDNDVQMWVVYPPDFDAKKKYPLLQIVHGGPHNGITTDFHYRWNLHLFASKGYVVACVNFHGSSGFGQKFTDSITGDLATKPTLDILKSTDQLVKAPYIDSTRVGTAGASYGGYMMAWLNGHTDRFKVMVCHAGVYNWHSMMASDFVRARERPLGALPWGDQAKIDRQSAQRYAANFKTPTLILHGEKDYRVPITQGLEYYSTLRLKGVPTRLVYFPDENHWIMKPQNSRLWNREVFAWLDRYLGSDQVKRKD